MAAMLGPLEAGGDQRRYFHATYQRTTIAVADEIKRGGFDDPGWVERWDVAFADLYLDALAAALAGQRPARPWDIAFSAAADLPPLRHVLLGMNAHINYDLPQALLAVITDAEFGDAALLARREADHQAIDGVLAARVGAEDDELTRLSGPAPLLDRLLKPFNRLGTQRGLAEAGRHRLRRPAVRVGPGVVRTSRGTPAARGRWPRAPRSAAAPPAPGAPPRVRRSRRPFPRGPSTPGWHHR